MRIFFTLFSLLILDLASAKDFPLEEVMKFQLEALQEPNSCPAFSQADQDLQLFCDSPYEYICSNPQTHKQTQLENARKESSRLKSQEKTGSKSFEILKDERLKKIPLYNNKKNLLSDLKSELFLAIDSSKFPMDTKQAFKDGLDRTLVKSSSELLDEVTNRQLLNQPLTPRELTMLKSITELCGVDGMRPYMFVEDVKLTNHPEQVLVVCDGSFFASGNFMKRNKMMLLHEMAHYLSPPNHQSRYYQFKNCLINKLGPALKAETDAVATPTEIIQRKLPELVSDAWALEGMIQSFKAKTPHEIIKELQESYSFFCGVGASLDHQSGKFRIEYMGNHPLLRSKIQCLRSAAPLSRVEYCPLR